MTPERNQIKEVHPGVFWSLLDYPTSALLADLLDPDFPFVLCWSHLVGNFTWQEFLLPVNDPLAPERVVARVAEFSFYTSTEHFRRLLPGMAAGIHAVQLRSAPPNHLDLERIRGKERWRLLAECGWHVMLETPGNDFGEVLSPNRAVVERAIALTRES